ncbi:MAG: apolipoprotein N-acyltransferase [Planctomycetia bacterium]|nr:apolipoprotein N-acyltransferase [Planctomycetia bacterium]
MATVKSRQEEARRSAATRPARAGESAQADRSSPDTTPRSAETLLYGLTGSALAWASLPPVGWWPLAWVAPVPWLLLILRPKLPGRRPYATLWLAGFAFWMGALHWLRLPHPATSIGWVAMSFYMGVYLPIFVGLARVAIHELRLSIVVAAPVVWAGLELAQAHVLTGVNIATLGHSQYRWIELIQISDLCGGYGVSFLIMLVAACTTRLVPLGGRRLTLWPLVPAGAALASTLLYGHFRTDGEHARPGLKVALIQGSIDTQMKADPKQSEKIHDQYLKLTLRAARQHPDLDLVVWPETMFRAPLRSYTADVRPAEGDEWTLDDLRERIAEHQELLHGMAALVRVPMLLGMDRGVYGPAKVDRYNSAVLVDATGEIQGHYDKMRPVMFGEYVPLAGHWPWLYRLTPLESGLDAGLAPQSLAVGGVRIAPDICFETLLPHFIRGQVAELAAQGVEPDVLVNLTNDGWFWGSSELDLHLMAGAFRAVECRKPLLIAANTGFSAVIDGDGRILEQGPRRATGVLVRDVPLDTRRSTYVRCGDWGAGLCLAAAVALAGVGGWRRRPRRSK